MASIYPNQKKIHYTHVTVIFNSSRLSIDPELVQGIDIMRGSDSFNAGSGSLGGSVNYRTLGADDIILPIKNGVYYLKTVTQVKIANGHTL